VTSKLEAAVAPLGPERTVERVLARELRKLIVDGTLRPGQRLRHRDLAQQFNVSVTPVRIALRELAIEGLVETRAHEGARVSRLSIDDLEEVYATRIGIESWLATRGAGQLDRKAFRSMDGYLQRAQRAVVDGNRSQLLEAAWSHRCICYAAAGRPRLLATVRMLFERSARYHGLTLNVPLRLDETLVFLSDFDVACRARDGRAAAAIVVATLERAAEYIIDTFPSADDDTGER
jgi:DNA-binding GntR family transcriptional regulator